MEDAINKRTTQTEIDLFKAGRLSMAKEITEWIEKRCACFAPDPEKNGESIVQGWQDKKKEWLEEKK